MTVNSVIKKAGEFRHPAGLAVFRIFFGFLALVSGIRFWMKGWIAEFYLEPSFFFKYYAFEWVEAASPAVTYGLYSLMLLCAAGIMLGWRYRLAATGYFLLFTYFELLDKTYYLNHYYFISIVSMLMIFLPANRFLSLDVLQGRIKPSLIKSWHVDVLKLQLGLVYFFAGIAKINADWLLEGMPMRIWLQEFASLPVVGPLLTIPAVGYMAGFAGLIYDCSIPFLLLRQSTRKWAYLAVVFFHLLTALLFPIGMFPWIMMAATLIFFPSAAFKPILRRLLKRKQVSKTFLRPQPHPPGLATAFFVLHFTVQLVFPFRYLLYPGELFWHEQGFRFSWRVMLMEKSGLAEFRVVEGSTGREWHVLNCDFLTPAQEKMMATQPDFISQYAHYLKEVYKRRGVKDPRVYADIFVSLNGRLSQRYTDPGVDLARTKDGWEHKDWVLPAPGKTNYGRIVLK